MRKYQFFVTFAVLILLACLSIYGQDPRMEILKKEHKNRLKSAIFNIDGNVTDTNNKELEGVSVFITFTRPKNIWATESENVTVTMLVNGHFSIKKNNYTTMRTTFFKQGYHRESFIFYTNEKNNSQQSPVQSEFHVKLRKIGVLAKLIKFDGRIEYNIKDNKQSICNLTKLAEEKLSNEVINLGNPITLKKYLYLDFERNKQGEIIYEKNNGRGIHAPAPKNYLLSFISSDRSDGFILIDEKTSIKDLSFLTDAPLGNYVTKKLIIPYNIDKRYYFYIRCGRFYGKGVINNIGARNDAFSHDYSLAVEILFNQKPEDRNLNSL